MGAAAAAENPVGTDNATMKTTDDATSVVSEDTGGAESLLGASNDFKNFTTLNNDINAAGGTVRLEGTYTFDSSRDSSLVNGIIIRNNITIDGQSRTVIDGSNLARIFYVPDTVTSFTLKNIVIQNAYTTGEGAVALFNDKMTNVDISGTFINNTADYGGVFSFKSVSGNINIDGTYTNNIAITHGAVIRFTTVTNSIINIKGKYSDNEAKQAVGVVWFSTNGIPEGNVVNLNGEFTNNIANTQGGGVVFVNGNMDGDFTLKGTYKNNTVLSAGGGVVIIYGAVNGKVTLDGTFIDNTATSNGGVLYTSGAVNGKVTLDGTFTGNNASSGGVVCVNSVVPGNMTFIGDFTSNNGDNGAILKTSTVSGNVDFTKANIKDNTARWTSNAMVVVPDTQENVEEHILYDESRVSGNNAPMIRMASRLTWSNVPNSWYVGKILNTTVTVSGVSNPKGLAVNLTDNGTFIGTYYLDENATVNMVFTLDTPGKHNLYAVFTASDLNSASSSSKTVMVSESSNIKTFTDLANEINSAVDGHANLDGVYVYDPSVDAGFEPINIYGGIDIDGNSAVIDGADYYSGNLFYNYDDFNLSNVTVKNLKGTVLVVQNSGLTINLNGTFTDNTRVVYARQKSINITFNGTYSYNNVGKGNTAAVLDMYDNTNTDANSEVYFYGKYIGNNKGSSDSAAIAMISHVKKVVFAGDFINNTASSCSIAWFVYFGDIEITGKFINNTGGSMFHIQGPDSQDSEISSINMKCADFINNTNTNTLISTTGSQTMPLVFIDYCLFENNIMTSLMTNGMVCNNLTVTNNRFINNTYSSEVILGVQPDTAKSSNITNNVGLDAGVITSLSLTVSPTTVYGDRNISISISLSGLTDFTDAYVLLNITGQPTQLVRLDSTGKANLILHLDTGSYTAVARYPGDGLYAPSTSASQGFTVKLANSNAGSFTDLNNLIQNRTSNVVDLKGRTFLYDPLTDTEFVTAGVSVPDGVSIEGKGAVIDADKQARIFYLLGNNKINNITFKNGQISSDGAAIYSSGSNVLINNSIFTDNTVTKTSSGGALYLNGMNTTVDSCNFTGNTAVNNGGAIFANAQQVLIRNSTFINNKQTTTTKNYGGAAIFLNQQNQAILNCTFIGNDASQIGIVYLSSSNEIISNCTFINNTAYSTILFMANMKNWNNVVIDGKKYDTITNLTFENNTVDINGILLVNGADGGIFNNLTFKNNTYYEGAFYANAKNANFVLNNATFVDNTGMYSPLFIRNGGGSVTLNGGVFNNNKVNSKMDVINNGNDVTISLTGYNSYHDNIYYADSTKTLTLNDVSFDGADAISVSTFTGEKNLMSNLTNAEINISVVNQTGDEIFNIVRTTDDKGVLVLDHSDFSGVDLTYTKLLFTFNGNDHYLGSTGEGYLGYGDFYILQKQINDNISIGNRNIVLNRNYTYHLILDTIGGISITDDNVVIDGNGVTIDAQQKSRIFSIKGNNVTIKNINIINGYLTNDDGTAILIAGANANVTNANFTNIVSRNGAIAMTVNGVNATVEYCNFISNNAVSGGAIFVYGANATIKNSNFTSNTASNQGGAIYIDKANAIVKSCNFTSNTAKTGGAIRTSKTALNLRVMDSNFTSNTGSSYGGACYIAAANANIIHSDFTSNSGSSSGGAIIFENIDSSGNVVDCNFIGNIGQNGAAVSSSGAINMTDCDFIENRMQSSANGKGIVYIDGKQYSITGCTFENNIIIGINPLYSVALYVPGVGTVVNISDNVFNDPMAKLYEISNRGIITLTNNTIVNGNDVAKIYNDGIITNMSATVLNNKTLSDLSTGNFVVLNASNFMDDKKNLIDNHKLSFIVYNDTGIIDEVPYDSMDDDGVAYANYGITSYGNQFVTIQGVNNKSVRIGALKTLKLGNTNISIDFESNPLGIGHDQKVSILLSGNDAVVLPIADASITIKITNSDGDVIEELSGITDDNGIYTFTIASDKISNNGEYVVSVAFDGNADFNGNSSGDSFVVDLNVPVFIISSDSDKVSPGENVILKFTLQNSDKEGLSNTATVKIDGKEYSVDIVDGMGSLTVEGLSSGKYTVTASVPGDGLTYNGVDNSTNITVLENPVLKVSVDDIVYGEDAVINVSLTDEDGSPLNGTVTVQTSKSITRVNVVDGAGSLTVPGLSAGKYTVSVDFKGDDVYAKSSNSTDFNVNTIAPSVNVTVNPIFTTLDNVWLNITTDTAGKYTIIVNGDGNYYDLVVGENNVTLGKYGDGNYNVIVGFDASSDASAITPITCGFSVVLADTPIVVSDLNISVVDDVIVNVSVPSGLAGQNIIIIINGTTKEFVVSSDGNVSANFTGLVKAGSHEITVTYDGDAIYKSNTTKANLTINKINTDLSSISIPNIKMKNIQKFN